MERYNFGLIGLNGKKNLIIKISTEIKEKFYCLEMFPIHREKFTWDMSEIILWRRNSSI